MPVSKDQLIDFDLGERATNRPQAFDRCEIGELTCSSGDGAGIGLEAMFDMCAQIGLPGLDANDADMPGAAS